MDDHTLDPKAAELRRFKVITGTGRRRHWSAKVKARIVAEDAFLAGRAGFGRGGPAARDKAGTQLFGWRREARGGQLPGSRGVAFVPIVTGGSGGAAPAAGEAAACLEIELRGVVVRLHGRIETGTLAEVLAAVKSVT